MIVGINRKIVGDWRTVFSVRSTCAHRKHCCWWHLLSERTSQGKYIVDCCQWWDPLRLSSFFNVINSLFLIYLQKV